jgi:hypothetical protein
MSHHSDHLKEDDLAIVSDLVTRAGIARVLKALAERCAFEGSAPRAPADWDEACQTLMRVAQRVSDLESAR